MYTLVMKKLQFTGERIIPEQNKGASFFYDHILRYLFVQQIIKNKIVLDAGCGVGYGSFLLAEGGPKKIYALDKSKEAIDYGKIKYSHNRIEFHIDNVEKIKSVKAKSVDVATCFELIEHLKTADNLLRELKKTMKESAILVISTPNKKNYLEGNPHHLHEYYPEELFTELKKYFKNVEFYYQAYEFTNIIKKEGLNSFSFEEKFQVNNQVIYSTQLTNENAQCIIAVCSDIKIPQIRGLSINAHKIDNFDLIKGFDSRKMEIEHESRVIDNMSKELTVIKKSKFYKIWRMFNDIKDYFFRNK